MLYNIPFESKILTLRQYNLNSMDTKVLMSLQCILLLAVRYIYVMTCTEPPFCRTALEIQSIERVHGLGRPVQNPSPTTYQP